MVEISLLFSTVRKRAKASPEAPVVADSRSISDHKQVETGKKWQWVSDGVVTPISRMSKWLFTSIFPGVIRRPFQ